jgi:hypothetical protein
MSTETSLTILVIILSITLAVFLILGIVLLIKSIKIADTLQRITTKAEQIADHAEAVTEMIERTSGVAVIGQLLNNVAGMVNRKKK